MSCLADPLANCMSMRYFSTEEAHWYAVYTNARHEKVVADHLTSKNIEVFLPTIAVVTLMERQKDEASQASISELCLYENLPE